jgi:hypothetical protein
MRDNPHSCPECSRVFKWGHDADSSIVESQGESWLSCRENAHWKLSFHMQAEHPDAGFVCPRRAESFLATHGQRKQERDWWGSRNGHKVCSYCGSMQPDEFFEAVEAGAEIGPTDKSYKVYVGLQNPMAGQTIQIGSSSGPAFDRNGNPNKPDLTFAEKLKGRYDRPIYGTSPAALHAKFYFQHLDDAAQSRFLELVNAKRVKIGVPGYFYVMPFFAKRAAKQG